MRLSDIHSRIPRGGPCVPGKLLRLPLLWRIRDSRAKMQNMNGRLKIAGLDHIVLNDADVERSLRSYCEELGLPRSVSTRGDRGTPHSLRCA
jgi:hypothetical protein